jgi:uncharacterized protein
MTTLSQSSIQTKESVIRKYLLVSFFVLAIGLMWIFMITDALSSHGVIPFRLSLPLLLVMGYMPTLGAVIGTRATQGKEGVKALFRKLLITRVGIGWYLFAIFGLGLASVAAVLLYNQFSGLPAIPVLSSELPPFQSPLELVPQIAVLFLIVWIVNGEELAWRGFALPRLQAKYNALTPTLILGVIWSIFHLPLFFTTTGTSQADRPFVNFLISTVALSVLFTWMYNNTRGSVLMTYLLHASVNSWRRVFSIDHAPRSLDWANTGLLVFVAVIEAIATGAENLPHQNVRIQETGNM